MSPEERERRDDALRQRLRDLREAAGAAGAIPEARPYETECDLCGGARFVRVTTRLGDPLFAQAVPCECVSRFTDDERVNRMAIPERYRTMTFDSFLANGNGEAAAAVMQWDGTMNLLLSGSPGTGKTRLAISALRREVEERGAVGRFVYVPTMLDDIRRRFGDGEAESAQSYFDGLVAWPLLVLDDLGAERATTWAQEQVSMLIERRLSSAGVTVITTNLDSSEAIDRAFGARVASRLGSGVYRWIATSGPDMRQFAL